MAPKRGPGRPRKRIEPEEAVADTASSRSRPVESRQSSRLSADELRELEALWAENEALRAARSRSRTPMSVSFQPSLPPSVPTPSAQAPVETLRRIATRSVMDESVSIQDFLRLKTPGFSGEEGEDPQRFLEETEKMVRRLSCSEARVIELVGITLKDIAWEWYQRSIEDRLYTSDSPSWAEFKKLLMDEFLSPAERQRKAFQFERLRQLPEMSVIEVKYQQI